MFPSDSVPQILRAQMVRWGLLIATAAAVLGAGEVSAQSMAPGMNNMPGMGAAQQAKTAASVGTVIAVNPANRKVTLDHGPIPEINWPAMKMEFATASSVDLSKVRPGDKVRFILSGSGNSYTVQSMNAAQ
jgi:Cu(I)/Ag(I) efflux system protein CusF